MIFTNPLFLFGLFALAIPIAVHLFNFRRYKIFYFSNTQFLQELTDTTKRRSQLKKIIILSLRLLAITCIVLAFARPYIPQKEEQKLISGQTNVVIYVDNSFSMESLSERGTLLDEAKEKAKAIVNAYSEADKFMLITNDFKAKHVHFFLKEEIKQEIDDIEMSPASQMLTDINNYAQQQLSDLSSESKKIYFISDFQASTSNLDALENNDISSFLIPLKANKLTNVAIDSCWFDTPVFNTDQPIGLHVVLKNYSENDIEKLPVKLFVNNHQKAIASADLEANGVDEISLNFTIFEQGIQNAYLEITDYPITFDDRLYFSFVVTDQNTVLYCYGDKENKYIKALFENDSNINYQPVNEKNIDYAILKNQDLIIVEQTDEQSSGFLQEMENYVRNGGSMLIIPSEKQDVAQKNTLNHLFGITTFTTLDTQRTRVSSLNLDHNLFKNSFEKYPNDIHLPAVFRYYHFDKNLYPNKETLIRLENGNDFLTVYQIDKGEVYLLAVPLDDNFSEFQRHSIFVPAVYNMAILQNKEQKPYYVIGKDNYIELVNLDLQSDRVPEVVNAKTNYAFIPDVRNNNVGMSLFIHDQVQQAGNYLLNDDENTIYGFSFNYNRKESDLSFISYRDISNLLEENSLKNYSTLNLQNKSPNAVAAIIHNTGTQLWFVFVLLALLFLLAESVLLRIWKQ